MKIVSFFALSSKRSKQLAIFSSSPIIYKNFFLSVIQITEAADLKKNGPPSSIKSEELERSGQFYQLNWSILISSGKIGDFYLGKFVDTLYYSVFHWFGQVKFANGVLIVSPSQFLYCPSCLKKQSSHQKWSKPTEK